MNDTTESNLRWMRRIHRNTIEREAALQDIARAVNVLQDEVASLQQTTTDYSVWDDTYNYVHKLNQDYIDTNYPPTTFESNRLNAEHFAAVRRH